MGFFFELIKNFGIYGNPNLILNVRIPYTINIEVEGIFIECIKFKFSCTKRGLIYNRSSQRPWSGFVQQKLNNFTIWRKFNVIDNRGALLGEANRDNVLVTCINCEDVIPK